MKRAAAWLLAIGWFGVQLGAGCFDSVAPPSTGTGGESSQSWSSGANGRIDCCLELASECDYPGSTDHCPGAPRDCGGFSSVLVTECAACTNERCCDEARKCDVESPCFEFFECIVEGEDACDAKHPAGRAPFDKLFACLHADCDLCFPPGTGGAGGAGGAGGSGQGGVAGSGGGGTGGGLGGHQGGAGGATVSSTSSN